jgi:hypothetical protein
MLETSMNGFFTHKYASARPRVYYFPLSLSGGLISTWYAFGNILAIYLHSWYASATVQLYHL